MPPLMAGSRAVPWHVPHVPHLTAGPKFPYAATPRCVASPGGPPLCDGSGATTATTNSLPPDGVLRTGVGRPHGQAVAGDKDSSGSGGPGPSDQPGSPMWIIDRYLLRQFLQTFFICFCSLTGLYVVFDLFTNLEEFLQSAERAGGLFSLLTSYYGYRSILFFDRTSGQIGRAHV